MVAPDEIFIARQPILNTDLNIHAYELLFRAGQYDAAEVTDELYATSRVLINAMNNLGIKNLLGDHKAYINVNENVIEKGLLKAVPPENFVIKLLKTTVVTTQLLDSLRKLTHQGYTVALGDFVFSDDIIKKFQPVFEFISVAKVDLQQNDQESIRRNRSFFKSYGIELLAEKVETEEDYYFSQSMGFKYFQGYFFAKPKIITGKKLEPAQRAIFRIVNLLQKDADTNRVVEEFKKQLELSVNFLKFMNSASTGIRGEISTIKSALTMMGREKLMNWMLLMTFAFESKDDSDSNPVVQSAGLRAKQMSILAKKISGTFEINENEAFLAGLLSLLDVVFHIPLAELLTELNVSSNINAAILESRGPIGELLRLVTLIERGEFNEVRQIMEHFKLSLSDVTQAVMESYSWSQQS